MNSESPELRCLLDKGFCARVVPFSMPLSEEMEEMRTINYLPSRQRKGPRAGIVIRPSFGKL